MTQKLNNGYNHSSVEDFLQDEYFVSWVLHPNAESDHFWNNWIDGHPDKGEQVALAREMIQSVGYKHEERLPASEYTGLLERLLAEQQAVGIKPMFSVQPALKIAAAILFFAIFAFLMLNWAAFFKSDEAKWLVVNTKYGQKRTLYLPDGTKVRLNAGSSISYPEEFSGQQRSVKFSGEGFFEVTRDEKKPFIVMSDKFTTRVIGTSFNLRSVEEEDDYSVAVVTGKVKVTTQRGQSVLLDPDDIAIYRSRSGALSQGKFDAQRHLAWNSEMLWFEQESLPRVFDKLERWYGVKINVHEGVDLTGHYTGRYKNTSLEQILQGITFTSDLKYKIHQKTVIIYE